LHTLEIFGVSEIIVLDLNWVGSEKGFNNQLIKKILQETNLDVIIGGGIRDISDLFKLRELGAYGALIGTSLYSNAINVSDLKQNHFLFENSVQP
jgi:phosphoribosylformimino-5-aminoimidazole carboxamide ribotide isomerase